MDDGDESTLTSLADVYCTGDLVRWMPDGNIEFLGRVDQQVKLRGFRIELGEIEAVLEACAGVQQAAVALKKGAGAGQQDVALAAYVVPAAACEAEGAAGALMARLREELPAYMVPSAVVGLERLPLTPNGKVDRPALPAPSTTAAGSGDDDCAAPATDLERAIQRVRQRKQLVKARDGGAAATVAVQMEQDGSLEAEEEASAFLMPFDPLKERVCRPSARYDPSLPHMQYDHVVPVTNIDAVLGTAEAAALLDLDISHVTITGAPRCPRPAAPVSGLTPTPRVPRPPALVAGGFDGGGVGVALAQVPAARRDQLGRVLLGEAALCSCGPRHAQARA